MSQERVVDELNTTKPGVDSSAAAHKRQRVVVLTDEASIVKVQSVGRRKLAQRRVMQQQQQRNQEREERERLRSEEIEMPLDELEVRKAETDEEKRRAADALRHPTHPFLRADPSKFVVKDQDKVAAGMQRVYRRMLQSRNWW